MHWFQWSDEHRVVTRRFVLRYVEDLELDVSFCLFILGATTISRAFHTYTPEKSSYKSIGPGIIPPNSHISPEGLATYMPILVQPAQGYIFYPFHPLPGYRVPWGCGPHPLHIRMDNFHCTAITNYYAHPLDDDNNATKST